jgi:hypothetical protein
MPAISDHNQGSLRPLICFVGTLRSLDNTAESLNKHLIEALDADVAVCVSRVSSEDEHKIAALPQNKIIDCCIYEDANEGYEKLCDSISSARLGAMPSLPWRKALSINGNWLGGLRGIPGSGMHLNYNYFKLNERLRSSTIQRNNYTHFIITRTDFQWLAPHPPLHLLSKKLAWIPEGEDYHGYNDRHIVCSAHNVHRYLNFFDTLISGEAYIYLSPYKSLNHEYQLKLHLIHQGIRVGRFKNLAYITGGADTQTNWSELKVKEIDGVTYYCKYPGEVDSSTANSKALAEHRNPKLLIIKPKRLQSRIPIWKARLRNLYPSLARALNSKSNDNTATRPEAKATRREPFNHPQL